MKNRKQQISRRQSVISNSSSVAAETGVSEMNTGSKIEINDNTSSNLKEEFITNKFRDYLLYGSEKEALGKK